MASTSPSRIGRMTTPIDTNISTRSMTQRDVCSSPTPTSGRARPAGCWTGSAPTSRSPTSSCTPATSPTASVLDELRARVPTSFAVKGNNDHQLDLPERLCVDVAGCALAIVHDSGPAAGRAARLRRWFPTSDVVVFGHSHIPWHEVDVESGRARAAPRQSRLGDAAPPAAGLHGGPRHHRDGRVIDVRHVVVGPPPAARGVTSAEG